MWKMNGNETFFIFLFNYLILLFLPREFDITILYKGSCFIRQNKLSLIFKIGYVIPNGILSK